MKEIYYQFATNVTFFGRRETFRNFSQELIRESRAPLTARHALSHPLAHCVQGRWSPTGVESDPSSVLYYRVATFGGRETSGDNVI